MIIFVYKKLDKKYGTWKEPRPNFAQDSGTCVSYAIKSGIGFSKDLFKMLLSVKILPLLSCFSTSNREMELNVTVIKNNNYNPCLIGKKKACTRILKQIQTFILNCFSDSLILSLVLSVLLSG